MSAHQLLTMERHTEPSHFKLWGPLERFIAHCSCGWKSGECYPEFVALGLHTEHVNHLSKPGTRKIKLMRHDIEWLTHVGPYPFTCNQGVIDWPEHTEEQVIEHHTGLGTATSMKVVRKLRGEDE